MLELFKDIFEYLFSIYSLKIAQLFYSIIIFLLVNGILIYTILKSKFRRRSKVILIIIYLILIIIPYFYGLRPKAVIDKADLVVENVYAFKEKNNRLPKSIDEFPIEAREEVNEYKDEILYKYYEPKIIKDSSGNVIEDKYEDFVIQVIPVNFPISFSYKKSSGNFEFSGY